MLKKAFEFLGNPTAMYQAIEKGRNGKEITIVFLGGSITEGTYCKEDCYVQQFQKTLKEHISFPIKYRVINLGLAGTYSSHGIFMINNEVQNYTPDIVFVDYSVNDTGDRYLWETFEGLLRLLLQLPSSPAVSVLLFTNQFGDSAKGVMSKISQFYKLPIINIGGAIQEQVKKQVLTWDQYACDYVHPTKYGHQIITNILCDFMELIATTTTPTTYSLPNHYCFGGYMCKFQSITQFPSLTIEEKSGQILFREYLSFRMMIIEYLQDSIPNAASVSISMDGHLVKYLNAYASFAWGNPMVSFIYQNKEKKEHLVEIHIAQENTRPGWSFSSFIRKIGLGL